MSPAAMYRADMPTHLLRSAFERHRKPGWPASFDAAMALPLVATVVRIQAALAQRRAERVLRAKALANAKAHAGIAPPCAALVGDFDPDALYPARRAPVAPFLDRKRAAAGEREDD